MRYAIIGAGLAGLTCAHDIRQHDRDATIEVFEAAERIGGKLFTVPFESGPTDLGAEAFLNRRTDAIDFFSSLGLADHLVHPSGLRSLVYSGGRLQTLPAGGAMGIPGDSRGFEELLGDEACARIDAESEAEPIDWEVGQDARVGELVRQRYGNEVVDRVVSALLGGVYSCTADDLGMRATIPQLAEALDELAAAGEKVTLSGAIQKMNSRRNTITKSSAPSPIFATFRGGYAELYDTLAESSGAQIFVDAFISGVSRNSDGTFSLKGAGEGNYDRLVLATPAPTTAVLLKEIAPQAAHKLQAIELASSAVVGMKFDSDEGLPQNSGVLVAADEPDMHAKAFTLSSRKWPHLAERGGAVVRASFGRFGDEALVRAEEDELVDMALDDLQKTTGFDGRAAGLAEIYVQRWFGGIPRFDKNHFDVVASVREELIGVEGVAVTGAWAAGVGVPNVIADARDAAQRITQTP